MTFFVPFVIGFFSNLLGSILPGLLNASAVKIAIKYGNKQAQLFVYGTLIGIAIQCFGALYFANWLLNNPVFTNVINQLGVFIFFGLSLFFFFKKEKQTRVSASTKEISKAKKSFVFFGFMLSLLNVFPLFYYLFIGVSVKSYLVLHLSDKMFLTLGAIAGAYTAFQLYIFYFRKQSLKESFLLKNINKILSLITFAVALITLIKQLNF